MQVIDSHAHLGDCRISGHEVSREELLASMEANDVSASIVLPFPGPPDNVGVHDAIARVAADHPGRVYGVASLNPSLPDGVYEAEVRRCLGELGFVGIKLHPMYHACPVTAPIADKVFDLASEYGVPVLIHTGLGIPQSLPGMAIGRARAYPDLKIVLCHAGAYVLTAEAIVVAEAFDNIYLETSWCAPYQIQDAIRRVGAHRVMFGADSPLSLGEQLLKYREIDVSEEERAMSLAGTARAVFGLPG